METTVFYDFFSDLGLEVPKGTDVEEMFYEFIENRPEDERRRLIEKHKSLISNIEEEIKEKNKRLLDENLTLFYLKYPIKQGKRVWFINRSSLRGGSCKIQEGFWGGPRQEFAYRARYIPKIHKINKDGAKSMNTYSIWDELIVRERKRDLEKYIEENKIPSPSGAPKF